ncbi:hypothetical protein [Luteibacter sp. 9133]|uniref:hypothetical protein n=1 Tax=Luteibacter sp. 9133 TaxID=1500891 RepID=UPI0018CEDA3E|nr:hypothetical protein [Luteibacter sp. 9133]
MAGSNPLQHQGYQRDALARANRLATEADDEVRRFRNWRIGFIASRRDAWGHLDEACKQALARAGQSLTTLRNVWAALEPLLTTEERHQWLACHSPSLAEKAD